MIREALLLFMLWIYVDTCVLKSVYLVSLLDPNQLGFWVPFSDVGELVFIEATL